jgi:hypothetical protein
MSCSVGIILLYVVHSVVQLPEAEFLDENLKSFPPCYSKTATYTALPSDLYFFKLEQPLTVSIVYLLYTVKEKGGKPDRKPYSPSLWFKKSIQKPQVRELSREPQQNCTFMNSAPGRGPSLTAI